MGRPRQEVGHITRKEREGEDGEVHGSAYQTFMRSAAHALQLSPEYTDRMGEIDKQLMSVQQLMKPIINNNTKCN